MSLGELSVDSGNQKELVDDILNAIVAALTAKECGENPPQLPKESNPEYDDAQGREIEIVFWPDIN